MTPAARRRPSFARALAYVILVALAVLYLAPIAMLIITSFKTPAEFMRDAISLPGSIGIENYVEAFRKARMISLTAPVV